MNWDDLRIFLAVTREGSLSAAARNLKVTQPTVGRRLKAFEEGLGTGLFDRLPDGMVLTTAGEELLPLAESMELSALAVDRRQASFPGETRGTVRLSIWESFAPFLTDHLPSLQQSLLEVEIELGVTHTDADLSRREADLLIRECLPNNPSLIARKLAKYTFAVYGGVDFVAHNPAALGEARYSDCSWVGFDEDHAYFLNQAWLLKRLGGRLPRLRVNNGLVLQDAVRKGSGLGVLPCFSGDRDPVLHRLTAPLPEITRDLYLVVHRDVRRAPAVRAVMDALIEIFKREAPRLMGVETIENKRESTKHILAAI
jgi:DNA-binding transcriptional LysR family regulator